MGKETSIQWADSTVNPVMGCDGCELWSGQTRICYAGRDHIRRSGNKGFAKNFDVPETFPGRMATAASWPDLKGTVRRDKPWLNGRPRYIFVSDMGDALSTSLFKGNKERLFQYLGVEIIDAVRSTAGRRHVWLWLTKRPSVMAEFAEFIGGPWPDNLVAMTSLTTKHQLRRVEHLLRVPARYRGLSCEPLNGPIANELEPFLKTGAIHWVILGGQSGKNALPMRIEHAKRLITISEAWKVPVFVKQLGPTPSEGGRSLSLVDYKGGDESEWPESLRGHRSMVLV